MPHQDIFSTLGTAFSDISLKNDAKGIRAYLETFPSDVIKKQVATIPVRFQRWWIETCILGHLTKTKKLHALLLEKSTPERIAQVRLTAALWLGQAGRLFEASQFLSTHFAGNPLSRYVLSPHDLNTGDIVLSYKTNRYLRHSPLSLFIKYATHSAITHVMIVSHESNHPPELLMSDDTTKGLGILSVTSDPGELLLVLEPLPHSKLPEVHAEIRRLSQIARDKARDTTLQKLYQFSTQKCEMACVIGFMYICVGLLSRYPISLKNPLENQSGVFCSELVDNLFRSAGIQLTARSEYRSIVGPIEFLYSPLLRLKGIIGDTDTIAHAELEVERQFGVIKKFHSKQNIQDVENQIL